MALLNGDMEMLKSDIVFKKENRTKAGNVIKMLRAELEQLKVRTRSLSKTFKRYWRCIKSP